MIKMGIRLARMEEDRSALNILTGKSTEKNLYKGLEKMGEEYQNGPRKRYQYEELG